MKNNNQVLCISELKKLIRRTIRNDKKNKQLNRHIDIIKSILFFISKVITIRLKYQEKDEDLILKKSQQSLDQDLKSFLDNTEDHKQYNNRYKIDKTTKVEIVKILGIIKNKTLKNISLGELYDEFTTGNEKKFLGQVYTPKQIVKAMVDSSIDAQDIIKNPYLKVIDPACGGGYFLLGVYEKIRKIILENYDKIVMYNKTIKGQLRQGIGRFILENNIWGTDIDGFAIYMTRFSLAVKGEVWEIAASNIIKTDSLLDNGENLKNKYFDIVISNPPYIGHKKIDKQYRQSLNENYSDVYSDKGDISYCFFKKGYELLKDQGRLHFISSRYFLESPSGRGLRRFLDENFTIQTIIDFYGEKIFKGIGISPVIILCTKDDSQSHNNIKIFKRRKNKTTQTFKENFKYNFKNFDISQNKLNDDGWILLSRQEKELFNKIDKQGHLSLEDISILRQGIITGCDRAFIIDDDELAIKRYEEDLIKPWIKNSDIEKYYLKQPTKSIIYSNIIDNEEDYPKAISKVGEYKSTLSNRRECKKGIRRWFDLQWGRDEILFKSEKIVFRYKSDKNKFAISRSELCSSADIYIITIRENYKEKISLEYLVAFLNSKVSEYYFKSIAKKLNDKLYEYYPNKLEVLNIKISEDISAIEKLVLDLEKKHIKQEKTQVEDIQSQIDNYFYKLYDLNNSEINLIEDLIEN